MSVLHVIASVMRLIKLFPSLIIIIYSQLTENQLFKSNIKEKNAYL